VTHDENQECDIRVHALPFLDFCAKKAHNVGVNRKSKLNRRRVLAELGHSPFKLGHPAINYCEPAHFTALRLRCHAS